MDPTVPDKCRCHWVFFFEWITWFHGPYYGSAAWAVGLFIWSIFPVMQGWPSQRLCTFRWKMDIFSGTFHTWCAKSRPLHLLPLFAVTQPALSVCSSSAAQIIPLLLFFFSFFFRKTWSNALELIEMFPSLPHLYTTARKHAWHEVIFSRKMHRKWNSSLPSSGHLALSLRLAWWNRVRG